jgi:hypothetical protein
MDKLDIKDINIKEFDVSKELGLKVPVYVEATAWQNLLNKKAILPDLVVHVGDGFVSLKNDQGEHILSVGFKF